MNLCKALQILTLVLVSFYCSTETFANDAADMTAEKMLIWSRQLGVTCNYCHDQNNFLSQKKPAYKVAVKHEKMVKVLAEDIFNDKDKGGNLTVEVNCYMCHRGQAQPDYKEPINLFTRKKIKPISNGIISSERDSNEKSDSNSDAKTDIMLDNKTDYNSQNK